MDPPTTDERAFKRSSRRGFDFVRDAVRHGRASRNSTGPYDQHRQPTVRIPVKMVAVNEEGKTFHLPTCSYLLGERKLIPAEEAVRLGYNPCIRCMKDALPQPQFHGAIKAAHNPKMDSGNDPEIRPAIGLSEKDSGGD